MSFDYLVPVWKFSKEKYLRIVMINYLLKLIYFLINSWNFAIQLRKVPYIRLWQILNHGKSRNDLRSLILSHSVCDLKNVAISVANAPSTATNLKITNWLWKNCVSVNHTCEISLQKFVIDVCKVPFLFIANVQSKQWDLENELLRSMLALV